MRYDTSSKPIHMPNGYSMEMIISAYKSSKMLQNIFFIHLPFNKIYIPQCSFGKKLFEHEYQTSYSVKYIFCRCYGQKNPPNLKTPLLLYVLYKHDENLTFARGVFSFINNHETVQVFLPSEKNMKFTLG